VAEGAAGHVQAEHAEKARDDGDGGRAVGGEGERGNGAAEVLRAGGELAASDGGQHHVGLPSELGAVVLRARDGERGVQRQLERADGDEPEGQRADDAGLQREGDQRRDAEGLVA